LKSSTGLLRVSEYIRAAVTSPDGWKLALDGVVELLGAGHAILIVRDKSSANPIVAASAGLDEKQFGRFLSPEAAHWLEPLLIEIPAGAAANRAAFVSDRAFERMEFYNEIVRPAQGFHSVGVHQELPTLDLLIAVCRGRGGGDFTTAETAAFQVLMSHLKSTMEFFDRSRAAESRLASVASVLDRLDGGVILLDGNGCPVFLNKRAEHICDERDGLSVGATGLATASELATRRLRALIEVATAGVGAEVQRMRVDRPSGGSSLLLTITPLREPEPSLPACGPHAAVFIDELRPLSSIDPAAVAEIFSLTSRESEIAVALASGFGLDRIARTLGMRYSTARSHLAHIFEKIDIHSQKELVAIIRDLSHTSGLWKN
jgi:DNA-binding CsgD family transcriptional regulator